MQAHRVAPLDNASYLSQRMPTYYQRLRDYGYRVGCIGKLDLGKPDQYNGRYGDRPAVFGWGFTHPEEIEGKMHAARTGQPRGPYGYFLQERDLLQAFHEDYVDRFIRLSGSGGAFYTSEWAERGCGDSVLPTDAFADTYIGQRAVNWIDTIPADFPWHCFVSFVGPHDPYDPPTDFAERYRQADMPTPIPYNPADKPKWVQERALLRDPKRVRAVRRQYCALIELIDDQIGQIIAALERRGMLDNTIIIYASDHGEMMADHGLYQKSFAYEASLRVPLLMAGPGIEAGRVSDTLLELIDLNPTICDLAGIPPLENTDALSLQPLLQGQTDTHRTDTVSSMHNFRCLRTQTHKFIESYNDLNELYDLTQDPHEQHNLIDEQPTLAKEMGQWLVRRMNEGKWLR
jgi:choline-sulfatase